MPGRNKCASFDEVCRRAGGRRAYNQKRLIRSARISTILDLQEAHEDATGRALAEALGVHEATISRDLKFIRGLRKQYRQMLAPLHSSLHVEMRANSFKWIREARGHCLTFEMRYGFRSGKT